MKRYLSITLTVMAALLFGFSFPGTSQSKGKYKTISVEKFQKKIKKAGTSQLIDVRTPAEFDEDQIARAINYNVLDSTLANHMNGLDKSKPVFVYCRSGKRGLTAAELLSANGFRVFNLDGGITAWRDKGMPVMQKLPGEKLDQ